MTATRPLAVLAVAAALLLPAAPAQAACNVTIVSSSFSPPTFTTQSGSSVTWCWDEGGHSVVGTFGNSGVRTAGAEYTITFANPGTFQYECGVHDFMRGSIVVQGTQPSPSKSPTPKPTTKSPTPARTTTPPVRTTTPAPTPTRTVAPTTAAPTTAAPTTTAPAATTAAPEPTTSAPATPSTTPAAAQPLDPAPAKPRTGLALAVGLLVAAAGIGGAIWLLLRGRAG